MQLHESLVFESTKDSPIVVIDSGIGGLYSFKMLIKHFPVENFIYFCDNQMMPIGNKDQVVVNRRINKICKKLKSVEPKAFVIACNTIDSISFDTIKAAFPKIPVFSVIIPTINKAMDTTKTKEIALLATKTTIENQTYMKYALSKPKITMYGVECVNLAASVENNDNIKQTLNDETSVLKGIDFDTLILGCTHYSWIKELIKKKFPKVFVIDCSEELTLSVINNFPDNLKNIANKQRLFVITTEDNLQINENINKILKEEHTKINLTI